MRLLEIFVSITIIATTLVTSSGTTCNASVLLNEALSIIGFLSSSLSDGKSEYEQICEEWIRVYRALCRLLGLLMFLHMNQSLWL